MLRSDDGPYTPESDDEDTCSEVESDGECSGDSDAPLESEDDSDEE